MINIEGPLLFVCPHLQQLSMITSPIQSQGIYFRETYQVSRAYTRIVVVLC